MKGNFMIMWWCAIQLTQRERAIWFKWWKEHGLVRIGVGLYMKVAGTIACGYLVWREVWEVPPYRMRILKSPHRVFPFTHTPNCIAVFRSRTCIVIFFIFSQQTFTFMYFLIKGVELLYIWVRRVGHGATSCWVGSMRSNSRSIGVMD